MCYFRPHLNGIAFQGSCHALDCLKGTQILEWKFTESELKFFPRFFLPQITQETKTTTQVPVKSTGGQAVGDECFYNIIA